MARPGVLLLESNQAAMKTDYSFKLVVAIVVVGVFVAFASPNRAMHSPEPEKTEAVATAQHTE